VDPSPVIAHEFGSQGKLRRHRNRRFDALCVINRILAARTGAHREANSFWT